MPSDDYIPVVRGALKLKGSGPSGVTKKKKKSKTKPTDPSSSSSDPKTTALQKALEEEDAATSSKKGGRSGEDGDLDEEKLRELEERDGDGKTASERAYEEVRRKRVSLS